VKLFSFVAKAVDYALPNEWHRGINGGRYWSDSSVAPDMDHRSSSSVAAGSTWPMEVVSVLGNWSNSGSTCGY
jgi:hypothetical protein